MEKVEQRISPSGFARLKESLLRAESDGHGPEAAASIALTSVGLTPKPGVEVAFVVDYELDSPMHTFTGVTKSKWDAGWPDWQDGGRRVEIERDDGSVVCGELTYEDFSPGPDESPYWQVKLDSGETISLAVEQKHWRFVA